MSERGYDSDRHPDVLALPQQGYRVTIHTATRGERIGADVVARSEAEAIRVVLRRARFQQRRVAVCRVDVVRTEGR